MVFPLVGATTVSAAGDPAGAAGAGNAVFSVHCASCHGNDGEGFRRVYPPLAGSRFFSTDLDRLPCIVRYGLRGELEVGGVIFKQNMPGNDRLTNGEILALVRYLQQRWGDPKQQVHLEEWLQQCE